MSTYNLKDKIDCNQEFINNLEAKSWQEVENLQSQIANIEENSSVKQLLNNLLTSYYIFIGGLENLTPDNNTNFEIKTTRTPMVLDTQQKDTTDLRPSSLKIEPEIPMQSSTFKATEPQTFEPFEYFVDFDEPIGEPISDEDLYNI